MKSLDIYLSSLSKEKVNQIINFQESDDSPNLNLLSFDVYLQNFHQIRNQISRNNDILTVKNMSKKYNWSNDLDSIFKNNSFEALVLTDLSKRIVWVNTGFSEMTGYSKKFAINKTPRFLQGSHTSQETKKRIQQKLLLGTPFKEVIINHKKDKSTYKCEISIFPLKNNFTTHFLALEKIAL